MFSCVIDPKESVIEGHVVPRDFSNGVWGTSHWQNLKVQGSPVPHQSGPPSNPDSLRSITHENILLP